MEDVIPFRYFLDVFKKRIKLILFMTIISTLLVSLYSMYFIAPVYEARTELLVNESGDRQLSADEIEASILLIDTYSLIIKSPRIMEMVSEKIATGDTVQALSNKIEIQKNSNTQIFSIVARGSDPNQAAFLANTVAETFTQEIGNLIKNSKVSILTPAKVIGNPLPVSPNIPLIAIITLFIFFTISVFLAFFLEKTNEKFQNDQEITEALSISVVGNIKNFTSFKMVENDTKRGEK
jgi:capsular polysaccharide biosynthesis protein